MSIFLDLLQSIFPDSWFDDLRADFGMTLSNEDIAQSVHQASEFFNMDDPADIQAGFTTGVYVDDPGTTNDDLLIFNRNQLEHLGITERQGLDLVMTHECAHRALQNLETGFDSHQEELCCDYMAGIRAGLNNIDATMMKESLADTIESNSHPGGSERVQAIQAGIDFAKDYMAHNNEPPTFHECLASYSQFSDETGGDCAINLRPDTVEPLSTLHEYTMSDVEWYEKQARISSGDEQAHWIKEAQWARNHLHGLVESDVTLPEDSTPSGLRAYSMSDVEWYEKQARISSGSEQAHWIKEAQWARNHLHGFTDTGEHFPLDNLEQPIHEFMGGQYGNATGDYIDDSYPEEEHSHGGHHSHGEIHAYNSYDENTAKLTDMMRKHHVDMPYNIGRASGGGLVEVDKSIMRRNIETAHSNGKISSDVRDNLISTLNRC